MKHLLIFISFMLLTTKASYAQEHNIHPVSYIFDPHTDAKQNISDALVKAAKEHKHIFMLIGGDWSFWCRLFYKMLYTTDIKKCMDEKYVLVAVNFSPENRNSEVLTTYNCPKNQGYPIIIVLDDKGREIHIQDTDMYKESGKWYDGNAILRDMKQWAAAEK